jgi:hypothetical protein
MAGSNAAPSITMKILIEQDVIAPARIILESHVGAKHRPTPLRIA